MNKAKEMEFFQEATMRICGSLNIDQVLMDCFDYLKQQLPLIGIYLNIWDTVQNQIQNIAIISELSLPQKRFSFSLPQKGEQVIQKSKLKEVQIVNNPDDNIMGRLMCDVLGQQDLSFMVVLLGSAEERLGVLGFFVKGKDQYTQKHACLVKLIADPFSLAFSNTLKHRETLRLKELLEDHNRYLTRELDHIRGDKIVGEKFGLRDVMEMVRQVGPLSSQVLILGETGVGKEVIANAVHHLSPRMDGPFIKVNCGAIPENLVDSELFGHEKGAFTGAISRKRGRFERAHKGTIFLDEIGELPAHAQVRLLRVIQTREIERVGGDALIPVDIRIIAATHRNLEEMIQQGKFREDLWFRLNVFPITVPPLRHRRPDIPALLNYFIQRKMNEINLAGDPIVGTNTMDQLMNYHWPGNVRELENVVERALIRHISAPPEAELKFELPASLPINDMSLQANMDPSRRLLTLDNLVTQHIKQALRLTKGRVQGSQGAAKILGINPNTLRNRMKKLGILYGKNR